MNWLIASRRLPIKSQAGLILLYTVNELIIESEDRMILPAGATLEIHNTRPAQAVNFEVTSEKDDGHFCLIELFAPDGAGQE